MAEAIISALLQVGLVLVIAGVVYWAVGRARGPFLRFVGLYRAPFKSVATGAIVGLVFTLAILSVPGIAELASSRGTAAGEGAGAELSTTAILSLVIAAVFKTSLSEELLFRGLLGKRLIAWLGFQKGNLIQAVVFGLVHLLLLLVPAASGALVLIMVFFAGVSGWINGWLNERMGDGSILPGWAAHAVANLCAYIGLAVLFSQGG